MTNKLNINFEKKIFSQNGEDGITLEILRRLYPGNITNKYFVEFGVGNGTECNTRVLWEHHYWNGLLLDANYFNPTINLHKALITKSNVLNVFNSFQVPSFFNLLSLDVDYNDFYILNEILQNYIIDVIILEYNASIDAHTDAVVEYCPDHMWDGSNYFGASLTAYVKLLNNYQYSLVYCESKGTNAFFIRNNIIDNKFYTSINTKEFYVPARYGSGPNGGHPQDPLNRTFISTEDILRKNKYE